MIPSLATSSCIFNALRFWTIMSSIRTSFQHKIYSKGKAKSRQQLIIHQTALSSRVVPRTQM